MYALRVATRGRGTTRPTTLGPTLMAGGPDASLFRGALDRFRRCALGVTYGTSRCMGRWMVHDEYASAVA
jgi:hypothetical protein